jgi:hypothetical protein
MHPLLEFILGFLLVVWTIAGLFWLVDRVMTWWFDVTRKK